MEIQERKKRKRVDDDDDDDDDDETEQLAKNTKVFLDLKQFENARDDLFKEVKRRKEGNWDGKGFKRCQDPLEKLKFGSQALKIFNEWLETPEGTFGVKGRPKPYVRNPLFPSPNRVDHGFGECLLLGFAGGTREFKVSFMNPKGIDGYCHHVALAATIEKGVVWNKGVIQCISGRERKVDPDALTISHLCGNGACVRPCHLYIEKNKVNLERAHCQFVMRHAKKKEDAEAVRRCCNHAPQCFVNVYEHIHGRYY